MTVYVGNLAYGVTEEELKELFTKCGEVVSVRVISDRFTGRSKGFAFVNMPNNNEVKKAIDDLNGKEFKGRVLKVSKARPQRRREFRRRF